MTTHMLNFSVCSNNETVGNCGEFTEIANDAWIAEACNRLGDLLFVGEVDTDSTFRNWHGGRFSNQASLYGYKNFGQFVVCTGWTCEVESEDGGTETKTGYWSDLPAETQSQFESQIDAVIVAADAGRKEVEVEATASVSEEAKAHRWAVLNQGYDGTYADWICLPPEVREEYEVGAGKPDAAA